VAKDVQRVGLLFVHGIGEQKRFEHLINSAGQLAEQLRRADARARISIVDRTTDWSLAPGERHPAGMPPITLSVRSHDVRIDFDCHEVWWADLGGRSGLFDTIKFWFWGLGQWATPIYRDVDAARLDKDGAAKVRGEPDGKVGAAGKRGPETKPVPSLARCPPGISALWPEEPSSRLKLLMAALAAVFAAVTLGVGKRIAGALMGQAPGPTIIVQYVGDVRTYTEPGRPGDGPSTDPGQPRRVAIRRRMIREMVALASKPDLDGWYVLAHSLGTIVAYNGLTEIGHTLPNYLTEADWQALPARFRHDPACELRRDLENMMPTRPAWLDDRDVINRPELFARLRGLFTYGSPLDKFASLWPRIVATATDRPENEPVFPTDCEWINLAAPHDPVAGTIECFPAERQGDLFHNRLPRLTNVATPLGFAFGLSHIEYLKGEQPFAAGMRVNQKAALGQWLLGRRWHIPSATLGLGAQIGLWIGYFVILLALWALTALAFAGGYALVWAVSTDSSASWWESARDVVETGLRVAGPVLGTAVGLVTLSGLARWMRESDYNVSLARSDRATDPGNNDAYWSTVLGMLCWHRAIAASLLVVAVLAIGWAAVSDWMPFLATGGQVGGVQFYSAGTALVIAIVGAVGQMLVNRRVKSAAGSR
jgi:hypothetical protein